MQRSFLRVFMLCARAAHAALPQHWLPDEELQRVLDQYDTNKDGVISFEEFKQIVSVPLMSPVAIRRLTAHAWLCNVS